MGNLRRQTAFDAIEWYLDSDGDGYGDGTNSILSCAPPLNHVDNLDVTVTIQMIRFIPTALVNSVMDSVIPARQICQLMCRQ